MIDLLEVHHLGRVLFSLDLQSSIFLGLTTSTIILVFWKPLAPPKCKFFVCLVIQDRLWRRIDCNRGDGLTVWFVNRAILIWRRRHTSFSNSYFSHRIWMVVASWLGLHDFHPGSWSVDASVSSWWMGATTTNQSHLRKAIASLIMLIS